MECTPGYLGGEAVGFTVYSFSHQGVTELLDTTMNWDGEKAVLVSEGLQPNKNYTLRIYGENDFGRSDEAFGIYISTPGMLNLC